MCECGWVWVWVDGWVGGYGYCGWGGGVGKGEGCVCVDRVGGTLDKEMRVPPTSHVNPESLDHVRAVHAHTGLKTHSAQQLGPFGSLMHSTVFVH
jgi:hypothetical protein